MGTESPSKRVILLGCAALLACAAGGLAVGLGLYGATRPPTLDQVGGLEIIVEVDTSRLPPAAQSEAIADTVEILRKRLDGFGVRGGQVTTEGGAIVVAVPGGQIPADRVRAYVGDGVQLEFQMLFREAEWPDARVRVLVEDARARSGRGEAATADEVRAVLAAELPAGAMMIWRESWEEAAQTFHLEEAYLVSVATRAAALTSPMLGSPPTSSTPRTCGWSSTRRGAGASAT
ncbi:MAG: hypothetical protein GY898_22900 [Proteobacteria bacterium]|nr:hypothetical protein [Pseudomonadota bacterium]